MRRRVKAVVASATVMLAAAAAVTLMPKPAEAHGAMMQPGSRTFLCWKDGLTPQGNIRPQNPACAAAVSAGGENALYNWFGVLRSDGAGRTRGFIPDGKLCSGNNPTFAGFDIARGDYPVTHLTAGANFSWRYSNWAAHPGTFYMYVTNANYNPNRALTWNDLQSQPFLQVTNPAQNGAPGTNDGHYYWSGRLPTGVTGRHIIYSVWTRSDSQETFYNCSDVVFDGGNGQVTGVGSGGGGSSGPASSSPASSSPASSSPASSSPPSSRPASSSSAGNPGGARSCTATHRIINTWGGGYQGEIAVRNSGSASIAGWTVSWPLGGQVSQMWGATYTPSGGSVTAVNETWNGAAAPNEVRTVGFLANGTAPSAPPVVACAVR